MSSLRFERTRVKHLTLTIEIHAMCVYHVLDRFVGKIILVIALKFEVPLMYRPL